MVRSAAPPQMPWHAFALQDIVRRLIVLGSAVALILAGKPLPF